MVSTQSIECFKILLSAFLQFLSKSGAQCICGDLFDVLDVLIGDSFDKLFGRVSQVLEEIGRYFVNYDCRLDYSSEQIGGECKKLLNY